MNWILFLLTILSVHATIAQNGDTNQRVFIDSNITIMDECIDLPSEMPSFPGGSDSLNNWMLTNLEYPILAQEYEDQGRVIVSFIIEVDGSISNVKIIRPLTRELDREAKRLIRSMPKWTPGEAEGKTIRTRITIPIIFRLQ